METIATTSIVENLVPIWQCTCNCSIIIGRGDVGSLVKGQGSPLSKREVAMSNVRAVSL